MNVAGVGGGVFQAGAGASIKIADYFAGENMLTEGSHGTKA